MGTEQVRVVGHEGGLMVLRPPPLRAYVGRAPEQRVLTGRRFRRSTDDTYARWNSGTGAWQLTVADRKATAGTLGAIAGAASHVRPTGGIDRGAGRHSEPRGRPSSALIMY